MFDHEAFTRTLTEKRDEEIIEMAAHPDHYNEMAIPIIHAELAARNIPLDTLKDTLGTINKTDEKNAERLALHWCILILLIGPGLLPSLFLSEHLKKKGRKQMAGDVWRYTAYSIGAHIVLLMMR